MNKISFDTFNAETNLERFALAMDYLRENPGTELVIPEGTYEITSELAKNAMMSVMTGEWGSNPQRIMFNPKYKYTMGVPFCGQKGSVVSAYGVTLLVDGFMEPVSLVGCSDIEIRGLTIDHKRKPYSRGILKNLTAADKDGLCEGIIKFDEGCPIYEKTPIHLRHIFYDPVTTLNVYPHMRSLEYIDTYHAKVMFESSEILHDGIEFYTVHSFHSRPAILIQNCDNIRLTDITIHSQPGMGIVGNRSENVIINGLKVIPSEGHHMSTDTDATHFTSMKGLLRLENCVFDGQGDDFTNVHGYYHAIVGREGENTYYIQEKTPDGTHSQALDYPDIGDIMELTSHDTLENISSYKVIDCLPMPEEWMCRVTFDKPLPDNTDGLMLSDITRLPRLEVVGCTASNHFARSILIKVRDALIEGNTFRHVQGPAIVAAAESWWYEGVCPANVVIRNNHIIDCAECWGEAAGIVVKADSDHPKGCSIFNILIEDNIIEAPNRKHGIYVRNTDGVTIRNNTIICMEKPVIIESCENVTED